MAESLKGISHLNINILKSFLKFCLVFTFIMYSSKILCQEPTDCSNAVIACGNSDVTLDVSGVGTQELNGSNVCSGQENNSIWLSITAVTNGTLGFTLTPNSASINEDYDFFVFGPNVACGNIGQAIRCSTTNPAQANQGNNRTGMNGSETDVSEGPGASGNSFVRWLDVNAGDNYFIVIDRPIGNSPFSLEWTGSATFAEPPSDESGKSGAALNFEKCDDIAPFSDGFTDFNLSENTTNITGTQTNVEVTFHKSASDANIGIFPLASPYRNVQNPQTIYARITDISTGCFELTDFKLIANLGPDFIIPTDLILCDNLDDGSDENGRVIFDLASKNNEILDGQNPSDFNVFYYQSLANAENRIGAHPNSYYNSNPYNEQVFVRIEDATNQNCRSFTTLNLIVNENPEAFNSTLLQCDEDGFVDGLTTFNLNEANETLTGGIGNRSTKFYTDSLRINEVSGDSFNNTMNPQIVYVEVLNDKTGCSSFSELILDVSITDSNNASLMPCDDDGTEDGFYEFNLSDADNDILNGLPLGLNVVYFNSLNDALLEVDPLNTIYENKIPYNETLFARVENANNCYGISELILNVLELPDIKTEDLIYYCLNDFPNTIPIDAALINDNPNNYSYNWSNGDTTYETQINVPGVYTVTVTNITTACLKSRTISVEASNIASFQMPAFKVNDLAQNNSITVFVTGEGTYQYSLVDEKGNTLKPYQDSNLFENIFPGIYTVYVQDIKNNCGIVDDDVSVIGYPKFFTPNNDGINDTWQVYGVSSIFQPNTKIQLFNRYGKLIKQISPSGKGFNGIINGEKLPTDDYWFSVKLQDGRTFNGHFALIN